VHLHLAASNQHTHVWTWAVRVRVDFQSKKQSTGRFSGIPSRGKNQGGGIRKKKLICQVLRFLRLTCCRLCDPKKWAAAAAARQPSLIMMRPRRPVRKIPFRYKFVPSCRNFYLKWVKGKIQHTVKEPIYTGSWKHAPFPQEAAARSSLDVKEK